VAISVNFNDGAAVALRALNYTNSQIGVIQKQISTGYRVADAVDNGAVFAIAQGLRSNVAALSAVNGQLGAANGLLQVTSSAATGVSNTLSSIRSVLQQLADSNITGNARTQLNAQYSTLSTSVNNYIANATYNSRNLISSNSANVSVIKDIAANQYTITAQDLNSNVTSLLTSVSDSTGAATLLSTGFVSAQNFVGTALNAFSASTQFITGQITFNSSVTDATNSGLGALVDADLAKASALLQSLQIKQQLGVQALSIANQTPQVLLNLFKLNSTSTQTSG
jgi:flagellin